jgi:hypothetical protein
MSSIAMTPEEEREGRFDIHVSGDRRIVDGAEGAVYVVNLGGYPSVTETYTDREKLCARVSELVKSTSEALGG